VAIQKNAAKNAGVCGCTGLKNPPETPEIVASLTQAQIESKAKVDRVVDELQLLAAQFAHRDFKRFCST